MQFGKQDAHLCRKHAALMTFQYFGGLIIFYYFFKERAHLIDDDLADVVDMGLIDELALVGQVVVLQSEILVCHVAEP